MALTVSQREVSVVIRRIFGPVAVGLLFLPDLPGKETMAGKAGSAAAEPTIKPVFLMNSLREVFFMIFLFGVLKENHREH